MITVTKSSLPKLEKYVEYLKKVWSTGWLTNDGEFVQLLESKLEEYLKIDDLVLVSNGTLALHLAMRALGLKNEVITTPFTFATTTNVILWEGLTPIFADIDPETYNINPEEIERRITRKTSAILAVHVYGNPCEVEELEEIADKHSLKLIYDAAHAFGIEYKNQPILNFGDASTLSFHATKAFNTIEGGAIFVKNRDSSEELRLLRNHGIKNEEEVVLPGTNAKMNEFQAIMGLCNLENIDAEIQQRRKIYEHYKKELSTQLKFQRIVASKYNYGYMPVCFDKTEKRDMIYSELVKNGIKPRKYFYPLTTSFNYFRGADLARKYGLRQASEISNRVLCLPLYPDLTIDAVDKIIDIVNGKVTS